MIFPNIAISSAMCSVDCKAGSRTLWPLSETVVVAVWQSLRWSSTRFSGHLQGHKSLYRERLASAFVCSTPAQVVWDARFSTFLITMVKQLAISVYGRKEGRKSSFGLTIWGNKEGVMVGRWGSRSHCIWGQGAERDECWYSAGRLLFI